jgi:hypothetical protein
MEKGKPFKETKVGKLITEKLPEALQVVGDVLPDKGVLGIAKNIIEKSTISPEEKQQLVNQIHEFELTMVQEEMKNTADARNREVQLRNTIGVWMQNVAAGIIISAFVGLLFGIVFMKVEVQNKELVYTLLGSLGTIVVTIFNYWFGGSAGSTKKTDQLLEMIKK